MAGAFLFQLCYQSFQKGPTSIKKDEWKKVQTGSTDPIEAKLITLRVLESSASTSGIGKW